MNKLGHKPTRRALSVSIASVIALAFVGCASGPVTAPGAIKADPSPDALLKRAQTYWSLVKANDNVGAWAYEAQSKDPAWSLEAYLKKGGIAYSSVQVLSVKSIEGEVGVVDVLMTYSLPILRVRNRELRAEDQWRLIDGVWYHSPPKNAFFPTK